jgi:hypothetical protein
MSSSITEITSTGQAQVPSTQNNKLMKIGGAVAVFYYFCYNFIF